MAKVWGLDALEVATSQIQTVLAKARANSAFSISVTKAAVDYCATLRWMFVSCKNPKVSANI